MAARSLFRSMAKRVLHGARGFLPPPPSSNEILNPLRGNPFVARMAAGTALRSLATKLASAPPVVPPQRIYQRGLHGLNSSSSLSPASTLAMAKARAGVAYVTLFGSLIYMYGWMMPRIKSLENKLKALKNLNECLTEATEAVDRLQTILDASSATDVSVQSSGKENGNNSVSGSRNAMEEAQKQHSGNRSTELESTMDFELESTMDFDAEIARLKEMEADLTKLRDAMYPRSSWKAPSWSRS